MPAHTNMHAAHTCKCAHTESAAATTTISEKMPEMYVKALPILRVRNTPCTICSKLLSARNPFHRAAIISGLVYLRLVACLFAYLLSKILSFRLRIYAVLIEDVQTFIFVFFINALPGVYVISLKYIFCSGIGSCIDDSHVNSHTSRLLFPFPAFLQVYAWMDTFQVAALYPHVSLKTNKCHSLYICTC